MADTQNGWYTKSQRGVQNERKKRHDATIYKWAEQYKANPGNAFPGSGNTKPDKAELSKANRRIRELEEEVAILKNAAVYFAKNSR